MQRPFRMPGLAGQLGHEARRRHAVHVVAGEIDLRTAVADRLRQLVPVRFGGQVEQDLVAQIGTADADEHRGVHIIAPGFAHLFQAPDGGFVVRVAFLQISLPREEDVFRRAVLRQMGLGKARFEDLLQRRRSVGHDRQEIVQHPFRDAVLPHHVPIDKRKTVLQTNRTVKCHNYSLLIYIFSRVCGTKRQPASAQVLDGTRESQAPDRGGAAFRQDGSGLLQGRAGRKDIVRQHDVFTADVCQ